MPLRRKQWPFASASTAGVTDWCAVIDDRDIDLVSIATANGVHREVAMAALTAGNMATNGFHTILTNAGHPPYDRVCPAPGHGLGFNDLKVIEVDHLLSGIAGRTRLYPDFEDALAIERVIHGIVASAQSGHWTPVSAA